MEEATGAPSSLAVYDPRRLRAFSRDGGVVVNQPPSPLTMLFSRHTRRSDVRLRWMKPVILPPGRGRPATKPSPTGSETNDKYDWDRPRFPLERSGHWCRTCVAAR